MDRGKRPSKFLANSNNKMYMDLKDIIREHALSFLPAKSLFRFRGVCRDWKLQTSTPFFAHSQSICCKSVLGIFSQSPEKLPSLIPIDPKSCGLPDPTLSFLPEPVTIKSSSNGLICCQGRTGYNAYYVCNPVTKQWLKIPKPSANHGHDPAVVLVFEPSLLNFVADFKLICPFPSEDFDNALEFDIYSSSEGRWKVSAEICFANRRLVPGSGAHAKGVVYWRSATHGVVAFDLKNDKYQILNSYYYYSSNNYSSILAVMNGKVCVVCLNGATISVTVVSNVKSNAMQMGGYNYSGRSSKGQRSFTLDSNLAEVRHQRLEVIAAGDNMVCVRAGDSILCYDMMKNVTRVVGKTSSGAATVFLPYVNSLVYI